MAEELKNATSEDSFFRKDFEVDISNKESCRTFIVEPETPTPVNFANVKETDEFSVQCDEVTEQLQFLQNEKDTLKRSIKGFGSPFTIGRLNSENFGIFDFPDLIINLGSPGCRA